MAAHWLGAVGGLGFVVHRIRCGPSGVRLRRRVRVGAYKGNIFFLKLDQVPNSLYNEADSSMEASDGLNPVSSQGYAEIQAVEARSLALAGQIAAPTPAPPAKKARRS